MYCHEGPLQKVDRIWMIHTDGTHNTLSHKRTIANEIAGHEFWGLDGKTRLIVPNPPQAEGVAAGSRMGGVRAIIAGSKTNSVFYSQTDPTTHVTAIFKADAYTGKSTKLTDLPKGMGVTTINADETLGAGKLNDDLNAENFGDKRVMPAGV